MLCAKLYAREIIMILDNSSYNKIKLLHELSCLTWFLEKHAINDAKAAGDQEGYTMLLGLQRDLQKHIESMQHAMCIVTQ